MSRLIKSFLIICFFISFLFPQKKMDFRSESEQLKDPKIAMKRSLIFPGAGQLYNNQEIKGSILIAGELFALWSFNENKKKYDNYDGSESHSRDYYLRKRNRFAWIAVGLYFYGMLDAVVEAHLDNFDKVVEENDPLQGLEGNSD